MVPGTNPGFLSVPGTIPRTKGSTESLCEKSLCAFFSRAAKRGGGGFQTGGGFPVWIFLPFFVHFGTFPIFPGFSRLARAIGDGPGIFPICPFPLSRPIKSTYEEQSRKGLRHNLELSRKKWETPGLENPRFTDLVYGPETDPKRSQTEPNGPRPKRSRNGPTSSPLESDSWGVCRDAWGGGGGCKGKRKSLKKSAQTP